jgi:hypothetical protein
MITESFQVIRHAPNGAITVEMLEAAYRDGMIRKRDLQDGQQYEGIGRGARIGRWSFTRNTFLVSRDNGAFGKEIIPMNHPEDDNGFALFIPLKVHDEQDRKIEIQNQNHDSNPA